MRHSRAFCKYTLSVLNTLRMLKRDLLKESLVIFEADGPAAACTTQADGLLVPAFSSCKARDSEVPQRLS